MRSCIIVQVRNSYEYIPSFLAYHGRLVDEIVLIDHNSTIDLRPLTGPGLQVYRMSVATYAQDLFTNYMLDLTCVRTQFDLLFVLDIDEFLPFHDRSELMSFSTSHARTSVMIMYWRNGYSADASGIEAETTCHFTRRLSPTRKLAFNLRRVQRLMLKRGNHNVLYPLFDIVFLQLRPKAVDTKLGLFHIPFLGGLDGLRRKIKNSPTSKFANKIKDSVNKLNLKQGARWIDEPLEDADMLRLVANYRTSHAKDIVDVSADDFEPINLFTGLGNAIDGWRKQLMLCPTILPVEAEAGESELVQRLQQVQFFYRRRLAAAFVVGSDRNIRFAPPAKRSWRALWSRDRQGRG